MNDVNDVTINEADTAPVDRGFRQPLCHDGVHGCEPDWNAERGYHYVCGTDS